MSAKPNIIGDTHERELLADILDSPGWNVLVERIAKPLARVRMRDSLANVQRGDLGKAQAALASSEAVVELIVGAYEGAGVEPPKEVRALREATDLISARESRTT